MAQIKIDGTAESENAEYEAFVEKFKPKKTTDDCYTPPEVYEAVADFVAEERPIYKLYHGDCLEVMKTIPNSSIDMVLCDLPYGKTNNTWDIPIDL